GRPDSSLPGPDAAVPLLREHRLYQADWLMRFYSFKVDEIVNDHHPDLDLEVDPKLAYALRHPEMFPVNINKADYELILRVPGIGIKSAQLIIASRRFSRLNSEQLRKIGVVMKRAKYFITCNELPSASVQDVKPEFLRHLFTQKALPNTHGQLSLF
ncbi:MAG: helix-hairpin-helix domain-containing protein, partial [Prevotellaceae bacterium]|nr:helix-hairpin-helix domain-containing protein [Prevotellaceae bacterium]